MWSGAQSLAHGLPNVFPGVSTDWADLISVVWTFQKAFLMANTRRSLAGTNSQGRLSPAMNKQHPRGDRTGRDAEKQEAFLLFPPTADPPLGLRVTLSFSRPERSVVAAQASADGIRIYRVAKSNRFERSANQLHTLTTGETRRVLLQRYAHG